MTDTRPLGEDEHIFHDLNRFAALIPLQVLHLRGELDPARVQAALDALQRRYPLLRAHIRYGRPKYRRQLPNFYREPHFDTRGTSRIPLRVVTGNWEDILAAEARTPLGRGKIPRLRATIVRDPAQPGMSHLILCADHATVDAQSINHASRQLLEHLAGMSVEAAPPGDGLPPPVEASLPPKSDSGGIPSPTIRLPNRPGLPGRALARVVTRRLDAPTVAALKTAARAKSTTLHGIVTAAFLLAIGDDYGRDELTCLSTLDLRRLCRPPLPADSYGCYVDIVRTRHKLGTDIWALARDVAFRLVSTLARDHRAASLLERPEWAWYRAEGLETMTHRRRLDALAVTLAAESGLRRDYGALVLEDVTMAASVDFFGPTFMVIAGEREGALDLCVNFSTAILTPAAVAQIADAATARLQAAVALAEAAPSPR